MNQSRFRLNVLLIFLFGFLFIYICYAGLPIDFNIDYLEVSYRTLNIVNYKDLIKLTINPLTPGWLYPPDRLMEFMRPLQILLFQIFHSWAPHSLLPFQIAAAIGSGILALLLFITVTYWTNRKLYGWLAVMFYASFPSNFFIMAGIASFDFQYYVSIFSMTALFLFYLLTLNKFKSKFSFFTTLVAWIITIWINIKLKSSEKIIPFVCLGFLLLRLRFILTKVGAFRFSMFIAAISTTMLLILPLKPFESWLDSKYLVQKNKLAIQATETNKDRQVLSFNWKNALQRTFYVTGGEFPFTTVYRKKMPRSITENMGFFLGWFFWTSLFLVPFILARKNRRNQFQNDIKLKETFIHFFWLVAIWFSAIIVGFSSGADIYDLRFLNFAYVPSVLLICLTAFIYETYFSPASKRTIHFRCIFVSAIIYTILTNSIFLAGAIRQGGGMQDGLIRAERDIFRDFYGREPVGVELYKGHQELENRVVFVDWYEMESGWFNSSLEKLKKENVLYFYTRTSDSKRLKRFQDAGYKARLWKTYNFLDAKPLIFKWFKVWNHYKNLFRKRPKHFEFLIYKITEVNIKDIFQEAV